MTKDIKFGKVIHPCDVPLWNGKKYPLFCEIELSNDGRLSITGVIGPTKSGNSMGGCGQVDMEFAHRNPSHNDKRYSNLTTPEQLRFAPGWDAEKWYTFLEIWHDWHLNDMRSACEHQRAMGWTYNTHHGNTFDVVSYVNGKRNVIGASDEIAPMTTTDYTLTLERNDYRGDKCPTCGYSIGSQWLKEELPAEVVKFLESLPDTDRKPNWV